MPQKPLPQKPTKPQGTPKLEDLYTLVESVYESLAVVQDNLRELHAEHKVMLENQRILLTTQTQALANHKLILDATMEITSLLISEQRSGFSKVGEKLQEMADPKPDPLFKPKVNRNT